MFLEEKTRIKALLPALVSYLASWNMSYEKAKRPERVGRCRYISTKLCFLYSVLLIPHRRKVLHKHAVDEDVAATDLVEESEVRSKI
jgi:hypothetical protein